MAYSRPRKTSFKKGSPGRAKRHEVAEAIHREHPDMPMGKKMAIATSTVQKMRRRPK